MQSHFPMTLNNSRKLAAHYFGKASEKLPEKDCDPGDNFYCLFCELVMPACLIGFSTAPANTSQLDFASSESSKIDLLCGCIEYYT